MVGCSELALNAEPVVASTPHQTIPQNRTPDPAARDFQESFSRRHFLTLMLLQIVLGSVTAGMHEAS